MESYLVPQEGIHVMAWYFVILLAVDHMLRVLLYADDASRHIQPGS